MTIAAFAQTTTLVGVVSDQDGLPMPGAAVKLEGTSLVSISDLNGQYGLQGIPLGTYTVVVEYMGFEDFKEEVNLNSETRQTLSIQMQPQTTELGEVVVTSTISGQAKANEVQKNKIGVSNVVSADQMGKFPDSNIGESVRRIPGITIQNDQGEARNIIIRGMAPQLNSVMINGERIPSAEGDNRSIQMDLIPADMIQTVEVSKTITPDMDADAIGGGVNLVTSIAPEKTRLSIMGATGLALFNNTPIWNGSVLYGDRFADNKLGVVVSASYFNVDYGSDNVEFDWNYDGATEGENPFVEEQQIRQYYVQRIRQSVSTSLDYQLAPGHTLFLKGIYNNRNDYENRYRLRYKDMTYDPAGTTTAVIERETKGGSADVKNRRLEDQRMWNFQLQGNHLFGNLDMKWSVSRSQASEERPDERYISYESNTDIPVTMDLSDTRFPNAVADNYDDTQGSLLEIDGITEERQYTTEDDLNARLDFTLPLNRTGKFANSLSFGGRYRGKDKKRENNFFEYEDLTGNYDVFTNSQVIKEDITNPDYLAGSQYRTGQFASAEFLGGLDLQNGNLFSEEVKYDEFVAGNYTATEVITAGYVMLDQKVDKLEILAGLRVENTSLTNSGFSYNEDNDEISENKGDQNYTNYLPSIHLKYPVNKNFTARAAWTNTLARPNYFDLVPYAIIVPDDNEVEFGNPNLNATTSMNFDLMVDYYTGVAGLISGGVFYKQLDNFVYTNSFDTTLVVGGVSDVYRAVRPRNGATADVVGVEVAFQRNMDFIPGKFWQYMNIYANYTYTNTSAKGIEGREDDLPLEGTAGNMINGSLGYDNGKVQVRVSVNYTTDYIDEYGGEAFFDRYYDEQFFLDVNASYFITPKINIFASATNLTNQPLRYYQGIQDRTMQMEYYQARLNLGVKWNL